MKLLESLAPAPLSSNIRDAIEHASAYGEFERNDFILKYEGLKDVDDLNSFDDLSSWLETDTEEDLANFRQGSFNKPKHDVPPIIVITVPTEEGGCITQIGDGRGRVNYAHVHHMKLHVWHLIHKNCQ